MSEFRLARPGSLDLVFEGELIADVSSKDDARQARWSEIRIYRTDTGRYVTEQIGRSTVPGEKDRVDVKIAEPADVPTSLRRTRPDGLLYLTGLALEALDAAAIADPAISDVSVERI